MEWARHRFRLEKPNRVRQKMGVKSWNNLVLIITVIFTTSAYCATVDNSSSSQREILHRRLISASDLKDESVNVNSGSLNVANNSFSKLKEEIKKRSRPVKISCKGNEKCGSKASVHHHSILEDVEDEGHRIQDILRDIFFDGLAEEPEEFEELSSYSSDDHEDLKNPHSRHIRSEPDSEPPSARQPQSLFPETGRSSRGGKRGNNRLTSESSEGEGSGSGSKRQKSKGRNKSKKSSGSDIGKYNGYMDAVLSRMNAMIKKKRMDPLRVNLYAGATNKRGNGSTKGTKGTKGSKGKKEKKHSPRMDLESEEEIHALDEDEYDHDENGPARKDIFLGAGQNSETKGHQYDDDDDEDLSEEASVPEDRIRKIRALLEGVSNGTVPLEEETEASRGNDKAKKPKGSRNKDSSNGKNKGSKGKNKKGGSSSTENGSGKNKNKNKNKQANSRPTRGVLHGLSTLKRDGNVGVIKQGDKVRIVRANFLLGPVSLEIMPRKSKSTPTDSSDKPLAAAATATAPKLRGVLEVRLKKGSPTRIRKLRVYPPKNVKVDSASGGSVSTKGGFKGKSKKPQHYGKVTPQATSRLRQIASTVVRQTDKAMKPETS